MDAIRVRFGCCIFRTAMATFRVCLGCLLFRTAACLPGPQWIQSESFLELNFPDRHGCNESAFWVLPSRTGPQWMQSECVLGAEFFGPPWLQLECVFGAAFTGRGMSSRTALAAIVLRLGYLNSTKGTLLQGAQPRVAEMWKDRKREKETGLF